MGAASPQYYLKRLFSAIGPLMAELGTFRSIANDFFETGIIETPEDPWRDGSYLYKDAYVRDKLGAALSMGRDISDFLRVTLPRVVFDAEMQDLEIGEAVASMEALGFVLTDVGEEHGIAEYVAPETLPVTKDQAATTPDHIEISGLPPQVQVLVEELNECLARDNLNAAALLTRKLLNTAVFISMRQRGKAALLKKDGEDVELSAALGTCAKEFGISKQIVDRVVSAKWIGDTANHSYRFRPTRTDVDRSVTAARLFLGELFG